MHSFHFRRVRGIAGTQSSSSSTRTNRHRRAISRPRKKKEKKKKKKKNQEREKRREKENKSTTNQAGKRSEAQNGSSNGISRGNVPGGSAERYTRSVLDVEK